MPGAGDQLGTFSKWMAKVCGLDMSDARWLRALEEETITLKRLPAEQMLECALCAIGSSMMARTIVRDVASGTW